MTRVERVMERIQASGGRVTVPTVLVATVLASTERHLTADDVIDALGRHETGIAASTVYRVLHRLIDMGVVEPVRSGAGATFYHLLEAPHTHLVCSDCGRVLDLDPRAEAALRSFGEIVLADQRFTLHPHLAALLGRCEPCATSSHQRHDVDDPSSGDEPTAIQRASVRPDRATRRGRHQPHEHQHGQPHRHDLQEIRRET